VFMERGLAGSLFEAKTSPSDGSFCFDDVPPGIVGVFAIAEGLAFGGCSVNVGFGEPVTGLSIALNPPGVIQGKVADFQGEPVAGARIAPVLMLPGAKVGIPLNKLAAFGFQECITGADGAFALGRLPQGASVLLKVSHPLYAQEGLSDVRVGEQAVRVTLQNGVLVRGAVVSRDGGVPIVNALIVIRNTQPPMDSVVAQTDSQGQFAVHLKPGIYLYQAGGNELRSPGWAKLIVTGQTLEQQTTLRVAGTGTLFGKVADAKSGKGIPGVEVKLTAFGNPAELVRTGPDGAFELQAVEGENIVAIASAPGFLNPERGVVRATLENGQRKELPTFWLAPIPSYSLHVLDENQNPLPGAIVTVLRPAQVGWRLTDAQGHVPLQLGVVPEDGRIVGLAEHRTKPFAALFALKPSDASGAKVQLLPLSTVRGTVASAKGKPLEGAVVGAVFADDASDPPLPFWRTLSRPDGQFEWNGVVPYAPLRCVAQTGASASGFSARYTLEPSGSMDLGSLIVPEGGKQPTVYGKTLRWYEQPLAAGEMPTKEQRESSPAVVVYCAAHEAQVLLESLAGAHTILGADSPLFVLVVSGVAAV
ncbi:MAG: carboxypeptidase regulatory-like domain-containing protein, partial [Pirellulaceae bacterium]|nr:carboxypeptidase regulatory-like domain-containing protein [Pirellulaceae bacterium]